jgi:AcrR family transcriptional regulator
MSDRRRRSGDQDEPEEDPRSARADELRRATERSVLRLSGELGYESTSVVAIVARSGSNLFRFYDTFAGKEGCYAEAYGRAADDLGTRLLSHCGRGPSWIDGVRGALIELAAFVAEDRDLAAGVIREVHVAGGSALEKRERIIERLSRAVDRARLEAEPSRYNPPPITSLFVIDAIESTVIRALSEKRQLEETLPALLFIAVSCYFGADAARQALRE